MNKRIDDLEEIEFDFPEILAGILLSDENDLIEITLDDFYDFMEFPNNNPDEDYYPRNDFGTAALTNQANILCGNAIRK